ncbi:MAG: hypothetical protein KGI89_02275 [Euryarchaeota archaeon]|nr:hypothetical protein [Euryarchaeota archaeon]MDE2044956.1 hypothetical protein [Thermoplasmata archaeon]
MAALTSVRVSRATLRDLEHLREVYHTTTAEETIRRLLKERRSRALDKLQGSWKRVGPFTEADRLESHD